MGIQLINQKKSLELTTKEILKGDDGASAYEVALANGFEGTEQEWLDSLKGEPGAPGKDGKTPVKGQDYFTNSEVQSIAQQAAAAVEAKGYLTEQALDNYYTKAETDNAISEALAEFTPTKEEGWQLNCIAGNVTDPLVNNMRIEDGFLCVDGDPWYVYDNTNNIVGDLTPGTPVDLSTFDTSKTYIIRDGWGGETVYATLTYGGGSSTVDLSNYYTKDETDEQINNSVGDAFVRADNATEIASEAYELAQDAYNLAASGGGGSSNINGEWVLSELSQYGSECLSIEDNYLYCSSEPWMVGAFYLDPENPVDLSQLDINTAYSIVNGINDSTDGILAFKKDAVIQELNIMKYTAQKEALDIIRKCFGSIFYYYYDDVDLRWINTSHPADYSYRGFCPNCGCSLSTDVGGDIYSSCPVCEMGIHYSCGSVNNY